MGDTQSTETERDYSIPCPYTPFDNYYGTGATVGEAGEDLLLHFLDKHGSAIPPAVKTQLQACAHAIGNAPV